MKISIHFLFLFFFAMTSYATPNIRAESMPPGLIAQMANLKRPRSVAGIIEILNECPSVQSVNVTVGPTIDSYLLPLDDRLRTEEQVFMCMKALSGVDRRASTGYD